MVADARVCAFLSKTLKWCTTFFKNEKFSQKFSFFIFVKIFRCEKSLIWPLLCTSKKKCDFHKLQFLAVFDILTKIEKRTSSRGHFEGLAPNDQFFPEFSKIGLKTVFLVNFTLTHEQKFNPKNAAKNPQNVRIGWVL